MWWVSIPSGAVVAACFSGCSIAVYLTNRFLLGNPYKRDLLLLKDVHYYLRDARISGNNDPYKQIGLESLSLEEEK